MRSPKSSLQSGRARLVFGLGIAGCLLWLGVLLFGPKLTTPIDSYATCTQAGYPVAETYPPTCSDGTHTFRGPDLPTPTPAPTIASVPFELLVDGDSRGNYPQTQEVITTQAGWEHYWAQVHASISPLPPLLPIDFTTSNVLAVSEGRQPTTGFNLEITSVATASTGTTVFVTESTPGSSCQVDNTPTNRYFIASTAKLLAPVSFRITKQPHKC